MVRFPRSSGDDGDDRGDRTRATLRTVVDDATCLDCGCSCDDIPAIEALR